jgi:hypothetical protein
MISSTASNIYPTEEAYTELQTAYDFYNCKLFSGQLPPCMITFQRERQTMGYFSAKRFVRRDGVRTDEIALNPEYFAVVPMIVVLQRLVREMVCLWQHHFGRPSRAGYHNREWADQMQRVGLMPSDTGVPGGRVTGQTLETYIIEGGAFQRVTTSLLVQGFAISWMDRFPASVPQKLTQPILPQTCPQSIQAGLWLELTANDQDENQDMIVGKTASTWIQAAYRPPAELGMLLNLEPRGTDDNSHRHKYRCPRCKINAWGKPRLRLKCANCNVLLLDMSKKTLPKVQKVAKKNYYQAELF